MAYSVIKKPSDYFNTNLWTGNGGTQSITGVGFQPDFTWIKQRDEIRGHNLTDSVRGAPKYLDTRSSDAEVTFISNTLTSFDSDGFSLGSYDDVNKNTKTYVGWSWLADNTSGSANTDGSISSTVSASATSGFSIVSYTGNSDASKTIGHGLGTAPSMIITKNRDTTTNWCVYHKSLGATKFLRLNLTNASATSTGRWNDTEPTSSVFTLGDDAESGSANNFIAYCFAEKQGFSKFGSYTGNGNADGTFVYTGFKPAFVITKASSTAQSWQMSDNKRDTFNAVDHRLQPNESSAEATSLEWIDFCSNGFKLRNNDVAWNGSGQTYIYMAFAEQPLVGDNPATAR